MGIKSANSMSAADFIKNGYLPNGMAIHHDGNIKEKRRPKTASPLAYGESISTMINIKPLSVNQCWQGKRFKTPSYKAYEQELMLKLPNKKIPSGKLKLFIGVGYSNMQADIDNFLKPFLDILQKKYLFNDNQIYGLTIFKYKTVKGCEYIDFDLSEF